MYEELVKRLIERAARNNFPHHGEGYPTDDAMLMMQAADAIRAFLKAKDDGRLLILDDRAALAIAAGARSIRENKRLAGTTYVYDVFGKDGGPYEINYNDASKILTTIWNAYPLPEPPKEEAYQKTIAPKCENCIYAKSFLPIQSISQLPLFRLW